MLNNVVARARSLPPQVWIVVSALSITILWAYWPAFGAMSRKWSAAHYSHGPIVPLFAIFLLWLRREKLLLASWQPSWWGIGLLGVGMALRLMDGLFYLHWLENLSILPVLAGLCVLLGGWPALRWAGPSIAFLFFMIPLPYFVEIMGAYTLRYTATHTSTYALQTLGLPALADGTNIYLKDSVLRVAPACSGMGMLLIFFALSTAIALLIKRPWPDKLVILLSAIPIAVLANIVRITTTVLLYELAAAFASETLRLRANQLFHDGAGYLMMLIALVLLLIELKILGRLFVPVESSHAQAFDFRSQREFKRSSRPQEG